MDLHGWDVAFVCDQTTCNEIIARDLAENPPSLSFRDGDITIDATFSKWEIVNGGSNKLLRMKMTVADGRLGGLTANPANLSGVEVTVQIQLIFAQNIQNPSQVDLRFHLDIAGQDINDDREGVVTVVSVADASGQIAQSVGRSAEMVMEALQDNFAKCLVAHQDQLAFVLSTLNQSDGNASWLSLKARKYSYLTSGHLAILGVVNDRDVSGLEPIVDDQITSGNGRVRLAISKWLFMNHILKARMVDGYGHGASDGSFRMDGDDIVNTQGLGCDSLRVGAIDYYPQINNLRVKLSGSQFESHADGTCPITGLTDSRINFQVTTHSQLGFDTSSGQMTITGIGSPDVSTQKDIPTWIYVVAGPAIPIVDTVIAAVSTAIETQLKSALEARSSNFSIANVAADRIQWPGYDTWRLMNVEVSDNALMRFDLVPTPPSLKRLPNTPLSEFPGCFKLTNLFTESQGLHLESNGGYGSNIGLNGASFMSSEQNVTGTFWKFIPLSNGYYQLTSLFMEPQGLVLEGNGGLNPNYMLGGAAFMSPETNTTGTMWKVISLGNGIYQLTTLYMESHGLVLEGNGGPNPSATLGGAAFMSSQTNATGTMWKFIPV